MQESGYSILIADDDVVQGLAKTDWRQRRSAIEALFVRPDARYVAPMLEQLGSAAPWLRHDAGVALLNLAVRLPAALANHVAALTDNLQHEDRAVRRFCANALVLVDPAHASSVLHRTATGSVRDAKAKRALELAFQSDLAQPIKSLSTRRLVAEVVFAALACALLLACIVWLSTRPSPPPEHHQPCPYYCRAGHRLPLPFFGAQQPRLAPTSSNRRPSQSGRLLSNSIKSASEHSSDRLEQAAPYGDGTGTGPGDDAGDDAGDGAGDSSDWGHADLAESGALGASGLRWRVWPWLLAVAVASYGALRLVVRHRKAKAVGSSATRRTSSVAAPVVQVTATTRTTTITTTTSVIEEIRLSPAVSMRMTPLPVDDDEPTLDLPPLQVVRSLLEPSIAKLHHEIFAAHLPYGAFARETLGLSALERVGHAIADRITRAYRFNQPILTCTPHPSPLFAVPAVHWTAAPAEVGRRRYADIVFMCAGAVPIGTQQLGDRDATSIGLNTSGDYMLQAPGQSQTDELILLGHPSNLSFGQITFPDLAGADQPMPELAAEPPSTVLMVVGPKYSHHIAEGWRVGDDSNPLSQLLRALDAAVAERSTLTILAPPATVAHLASGLQDPRGALTNLSTEPPRALMLTNGWLDNEPHAVWEPANRPAELSAATHVLILEAEAVEAAALAAAAQGTRVAACRAGRFYLSEKESVAGDARALTDYTLPHPSVFGPELEEKVRANTLFLDRSCNFLEPQLFPEPA